MELLVFGLAFRLSGCDGRLSLFQLIGVINQLGLLFLQPQTHLLVFLAGFP